MTQKNNHPVEATLSRDLRLFDVTMIGVGAMIGAGIFVLTGHAAGAAGPAFLIAFLLNGLIAFFTASSYAELSSTIHDAGGSYLWVKEGFSPFMGFLSGWMNWFAHAAACSLYAVAFGTFASSTLHEFNITPFGLPPATTAQILTVAAASLFTFVNYMGSSETSAVGNLVTMTKVLLLLAFAFFGAIVLFRSPDWPTKFVPFAPKGLLGIVSAMGLTTIAFQGYEVIAQCGEEIENPHRNLPIAIFAAIGIVVFIYITVGFVAIGSIDLSKIDPAIKASLPSQIQTTWQFLAHFGETAIVEAARQVMPYGAYVILFAGLVSTMSALNATIYSSSRVAFAMGRDRNLPPIFGKVHPKRHTPHWAVFLSGGLVILLTFLPSIKDIASSADIMFLMIFAMINLTVIRLRQKRPDLPRGFRIPLMPLFPILGIVCQSILAFSLFELSPIAWYTTLVWIVAGIVFYFAYARRTEAMEEPGVILHEEIVAVKEFSVLFPVDRKTRIEAIMPLACALARARDGEVFALHVISVPAQLDLRQGRYFLREGKALLSRVIEAGKEWDVPVRTMIRLGRDEVRSIARSAREREANFLLLDWRGYTRSAGRQFGHVIDRLVDNPPCDLGVLSMGVADQGINRLGRIRKILVPVGGGPNAILAARLAAWLAREYEGSATLLCVCSPDASAEELGRQRLWLEQTAEGLDFPFEQTTVFSENVVNGILEHASSEEFDLIIIGASHRGLFRRILIGEIPEQVATHSPIPVLMVRRHEAWRALIRSLRPSVPVEPPVEGSQP